MASITITVGTVTATRTYPDNQRAGRVLTLYADAEGIDSGLAPQARLEKTIESLVEYMVVRARVQEVAAAAEAARAAAQEIGVG